MAAQIVKRAGHSEAYDERKLYASIYAVALSVRVASGSAELIAATVVERVESWLGRKHNVTANDIRVQAAKQLDSLNPDAALQYRHHRVVW